VTNVAPTATFAATSPINEGSSSSLSLTGPSDPSSARSTEDTSESQSLAYLESSLPPAYASAGATSTASCSFDDNGSYTVKGRISDNDTLPLHDALPILVTNVAPTATFAATSPINEGSSSSLSLTGPSDPSSA